MLQEFISFPIQLGKLIIDFFFVISVLLKRGVQLHGIRKDPVILRNSHQAVKDELMLFFFKCIWLFMFELMNWRSETLILYDRDCSTSNQDSSFEVFFSHLEMCLLWSNDKSWAERILLCLLSSVAFSKHGGLYFQSNLVIE